MPNNPVQATLSSSLGGREHRFYFAMSLAMAAVVFVGFARTFFLAFLWSEHSPDASSDLIYYVHGVFFATWIVLLVTQTLLISTRRVIWHRRAGWSAVLLIPLIVITGVAVCVAAATRPDTPELPVMSLDFMGVLVTGIAMFAALAALGVMYRRRAGTHKRLMLLATVNLLQAAVVRIPLEFTHFQGPVRTFLLAYSILIPLVFWDLVTRRRLHPVTLWGGGAIVASLPLRLWFSTTPLWQSIAEWLTRHWMIS